MYSRTDSRKFKTMSRRELLKLTPVIALGAFAIPQLQKPLLKGGLGFSDWASAKVFRSGHLAPTFADSELTPLDKFPISKDGKTFHAPGCPFIHHKAHIQTIQAREALRQEYAPSVRCTKKYLTA